MEILFSEHAVARMFERKVSSEMVRAIIDSPTGTIKQSMDKWIFYKSFSGRRDHKIAAVVIRRVDLRFEVITVMVNFEVQS